MFRSTYLPVNMQRINCAVYSNEKCFPKDSLLEAYKVASGDYSTTMTMSDGYITSMTDPTVHWSMEEVFLAYQAYDQAEKANFSFYMAKDKTNIPQLFISKAFKGHRILVDAFSMRSITLGNRQLVTKAATLIDKTITMRESTDLFHTMCAIEQGSAKFLPALLVGRGTSEEYIAFSPMTMPWSENTTFFGTDLIKEIIEVMNGAGSCGSVSRNERGDIYRNDMDGIYQPMSEDVVAYIVDIYYRTMDKKSNYVELYNPNYEVELFLSTNNKYLVNAKTFEVVVLKNQHVKNLLMEFVKMQTVSSDQLQLAWMLAKTE